MKKTSQHPLVKGIEFLEAIYEVDQSPHRKVNLAPFQRLTSKVFDEIRIHFAQLPVSRMRGYTNSRFSFQHRRRPLRNLCRPRRDQDGKNFLLRVTCLRGLRRHPLQRGHPRSGVYRQKYWRRELNMTISEAAEFFRHQIRRFIGRFSFWSIPVSVI